MAIELPYKKSTCESFTQHKDSLEDLYNKFKKDRKIERQKDQYTHFWH